MKRNHQSDLGSNPEEGQSYDSPAISLGLGIPLVSGLGDSRPIKKRTSYNLVHHVLSKDSEFKTQEDRQESQLKGWRYKMLVSEDIINQDLRYRDVQSSNLTSSNLLGSRWFVELWVRWLIEEISISDDGWVNGCVELYMPGWLFLQIGRVLWPQHGDRWLDRVEKTIAHIYKRVVNVKRFTSVAIIRALREQSDNGYLVEVERLHQWRNVTNYGNGRFPVLFRCNGFESPPTMQYPDCEAWQIIEPKHIQPGMSSQKNAWVPIDMDGTAVFVDGSNIVTTNAWEINSQEDSQEI